MAELEYKAAKTPAAKAEVLGRLKGIVESTAEFLADFPERRIGTGTDGEWLDLGPPLVSASEGEGPYDVWNPSYELTQFNFSLDVANQWRERLGLERNKDWDHVRMNLAPLPVTSTNPSGKPTYNRHQNCLPSVFGPGKTRHCEMDTPPRFDVCTPVVLKRVPVWVQALDQTRTRLSTVLWAACRATGTAWTAR